ncbi:phytoene/squalene synthase family protein [Streptomyces sp. NPDC127068]|uniref:phytoene/squalene synthase family protein n=1 Tax=Streptomyces sp. NPDC127068 TaxID=3347127 RepID=UPI0036698E03
MNRTNDRILNAAGIRDPVLRLAYERCRRLHARHGRTYYLATRLLPPWKRPYVHALYGFSRYTDELVDNGPEHTRAAHFHAWSRKTLERLGRDSPPFDGPAPVGPVHGGSPTGDQVILAFRHTMRRWNIPLEYVVAFLNSMEADLSVTKYPTYEALNRYMYGSAGVIGLQMLPILGPLCDEAHSRARALGEASQLTNCIRDVAEDLARGRVYLPTEDLDRFGVTIADLSRSRTIRPVRELLRYEIERNRKLYAYAVGVIRMLEPSSRPFIEMAYALYAGILDAVEEARYEVLDRRVAVGLSTRLRIAGPAYALARREWGDAL